MKLAVTTAALMLLGACASSGGDGGVMNGRAMAEKTVETNENGEEIICKKEKETGSRVRVKEVCGTEAEWEIMREANRKGVNDLTGNRAASNSQ